VLRYLFTILALCAPVSVIGAQWDDPALPMADSEKPLLQSVVPGVLGIGGLHKKVRVPSTDDLKKKLDLEYKQKLQDLKIAEIKRGSWLFLTGLLAAGCGFAMHFMTSYPVAQRFSEWVLCGGLATSAIGLILKKAAEYQNWIFLALVAAAAIGVLVRFKDWSFSHLFKKKAKK